MLSGVDPMYAGTPQQMLEGNRNGVQVTPKLFHTLNVSVIGAINGSAIGIGHSYRFA